MPLPPEIVADLARRLHDAERTKEPIPQISRMFPGMTMEDSYAIQAAWLEIKHGKGHKTIGYKIGLTSRAMQSTYGCNEPAYGSLLDDVLFDEATDIPLERFVRPLVEVELAFTLVGRLQVLQLEPDVREARAEIEPHQRGPQDGPRDPASRRFDLVQGDRTHGFQGLGHGCASWRPGR
jgi:2-oxo-hept-3-ene-1,7-dioate hydratase